jgi:fatty-acyl-CoA synthase
VVGAEIDHGLTGINAIKEAATIGLPGDDDKETVHVVLVPEDRANAPDLTRLTREIVDALGDLYTPASLSITESLPRTTVGKTDKKPSARPC